MPANFMEGVRLLRPLRNDLGLTPTSRMLGDDLLQRRGRLAPGCQVELIRLVNEIHNARKRGVVDGLDRDFHVEAREEVLDGTDGPFQLPSEALLRIHAPALRVFGRVRQPIEYAAAEQ